MHPEFSVIIPTYNRKDMLVKAIKSVLSQTYNNFEIIVVNDAGEDVAGTISELNYENKIKYLQHSKNKGIAASRNTALKSAKGTYIAYLDDDDIYYPHHLETLRKVLQEGTFKIVYSDAHVICQTFKNNTYVTTHRKVAEIYDFSRERLFVSNYIPVINVAHSSDLLREIGYFDESLKSHEDWEFWLRMAQKHDFYHIKNVTTAFTKRTDNTSLSTGNRTHLLETFRIVQSRYVHLVTDEKIMEGMGKVERRLMKEAAPEITSTLIKEYEAYHQYFFIKEMIRSKRILEIGFSISRHCPPFLELAESVCRLVRNASDKNCQNDISDNLHFISGISSQLPFQGDSVFDVILCDEVSDVLVKEARRVLTQDGVLICFLPACTGDAAIVSYREMLERHIGFSILMGQKTSETSNIFPVPYAPVPVNKFCVQRENGEYLPADKNILPDIYFFISSTSSSSLKKFNMDSIFSDITGALSENIKKNLLNIGKVLDDRDVDIENYKSIISEKDRLIEDFESMIYEKDQNIKESLSMIHEKDKNISESLSMIRTKDKIIEEAIAAVDEKENIIQELLHIKNQKDNDIEGLLSSITEKDVHIENFQALIAEKDGHINNFQNLVQEFEKSIAAYQQMESELISIKQSKVWRTSEFLRHLIYIRVLGKIPILQKLLLFITRYGFKSTIKRGKEIINRRIFKREGTREFQGHDVNSSYSGWLKQHSFHPNMLETLLDNIQAYSIQPQICFILYVPKNNRKYQNSIHSIINQVYNNWELILLDGLGMAEDFKVYPNDDRIRILTLEENDSTADGLNMALEESNGKYVVVLHGDYDICPSGLYEYVKLINSYPEAALIYCDEDVINIKGERSTPVFKPDYSPDLLLSKNYLSGFTLFRRSVVDRIGGFNKNCPGSEVYDFYLRLAEYLPSERIFHLPKVLCHLREDVKAFLNGDYLPSEKLLSVYMKRNHIEGHVLKEGKTGYFRVERSINKASTVGIIIPFRDKVSILKNCIDSVFQKTTYEAFHIYLVNNQSQKKETVEYLKVINQHPQITCLDYDRPFNYSAINNYAASCISSDYLLFLNNDIEIITPDWIEKLLEHAQRKDIGAAGPLLLYPQRQGVQHAGIISGVSGVAGHIHRFKHEEDEAHDGWFDFVRNVSAVTGACMMVKKDVFDSVGGFDEAFSVNFNDVDFCLTLRKNGYLNVFIPFVKLVHHEKATRKTSEPGHLIGHEMKLFKDKWKKTLMHNDPYLNVNIPISSEQAMEKFMDSVCMCHEN